MAVFDQAADAGKIQKFAERMKAAWGGQQILDREALKLITLTQHFTTASDDAGPKASFESGIGYTIFNENRSLLDLKPGIRCEVPKHDLESREFANNVLEPWLAGVVKRSQEGEPVDSRIGGDLAAVGRSVTTFYPVPRLWVSDDYLGLVKQLQGEQDPEEVARIQKEIRKFKQGRFPMRWRRVDYRSCWSIFGGEHRLPQVIELRKMTLDEIEDEYGEKAIPGDYKGKGGTTEIDVYEWANHFAQATIIGSKGDPKFAKEPFEHGLEMSPYIFMEGPILPDNDNNWRWAGSVFHCADAIHQFDQVLTDWTVNHHEWTRAPINVFLDREAGWEPKADGRAPDIEYGAGGINYFWKGDEIRKGITETLNDQSPGLLQELKGLIERFTFNAVLQGQAKSGASEALYRSQVYQAQRNRDPYVSAIERGYENLGVLALRCPKALNKVALELAEGDKDFAASIDAVAVYSDMPGKKGVIEVTPKQVQGWEPSLRARASRTLRMDETLATQVAVTKVDKLGVSMAQVLEEDLFYENPEQVLARGEE